MKQLLWVFALVCCAASVAMAGPNAGGVLLVHDTGMAYSGDMTVPPVTVPPANAGEIDDEAYFGDAGSALVWKVYAVFPPASSPRLKGVSWGIGITHAGTGGIVVQDAGLPDPVNDFQVVQGGWPYTDGASIGQSFPTGAKLTTVAELYWFGGYAYGGASNTPQAFSTQAHVVSTPMFVDDSVPAVTDDIGGYGTLDFTVNPTAVDDPPAFNVDGVRFQYANPYRAHSPISLALSSDQVVAVTLYDAAGRQISRLFDGSPVQGRIGLSWDGRTDTGIPAGSGIYFLDVRGATSHARTSLVWIR